jgi:2,4-diaminopentanoate dehydrogenase
MTYRIVQWATGNIGVKSVHAVVANSELELVGCYAWSPDKVGRDVGELCGIPPLGIAATDDVAALLALKPDCVVYNAQFADVDHLVRILEAGVNVVTTSEFITGHRLGQGRQRIIEACERGGATIFGSGLNPGFIQLFAIVSAGLSDRVDRIRIVESFDTTIYNSPETEKIMGFGYPVDDPDLPAVTAEGSGIFREAVMIVADALGAELDDIRCEAAYAAATEDIHLPGDWVIGAGCVAGIDVSWKGYVGDRDVIEVRGVWTKGQALEPIWEMGFGYDIVVEGRPTIRTTLAFEPPPDFVAETIEEYILLGLTITAVPAVTAIPAVVDAPPGIATYNDLPLLQPRGVLNVG